MEPQNFVKGSQTSENLENVSDRESSIESFHTNQSEPSTTTESELIDVDDIELSDEESWLYKSPKKAPLVENYASTKQHNLNEDIKDDAQKETRHALLSKLNQLKYRDARNGENKSLRDATVSSNYVGKTIEQQEAGNTKSVCLTNNATILDKSNGSSINESVDPERKTSHPKKESQPECLDSISSPLLDLVDVQKLAKLQAESLKHSTYKYLNHSGSRTPSSRDLSPDSPTQVLDINKPASVEGLNTCCEGINHSNIYSIVPLQGMRKQSLFGSSSALNASPEYRSGSLPNISKGYYSLKSRKSKRPNEQKISCPLPVYPTNSKIAHSGSSVAVSTDHNDSLSSYDNPQSNTLPSSYRMNSRRSSSNPRGTGTSACHRDLTSVSPTKRRDSTPVTGSNSSLNSNCNYRKFSSPVPLNASPRYAAALSPTKAFVQSQSLRFPSGAEYHRSASHSPARRLPLAMVQHQSSKHENSLRNGEMRQILVPSKLQNRSGIPVPSAYQSRPDDETWSQDCF